MKGKGEKGSMKVIIVGGVAGGASCAARLRRLDENAADHHGRARAVRLVRELRPALSRRRRDREGIEPAGGRREYVPLDVRDRRQNALRVHQGVAGQEDGRAAQRRHRRGDDRVLRQAGAVARRAVDPPAAARHRPPGHLRAEDRSRREGDPRVAREGLAVPRRDAPVRGIPVGAAEDPRRGGRRRLHRHRDGGEPHPPRLRRHARRDGRPDPGADGPGDGAHRRRLPRAPRPAPRAQGRRGRIRARARAAR